MNTMIPLRKAAPLFLTVIALAQFVVCPLAYAVVPAPDGGYANFTTAEGTNALKNLTTGAGNTGIGWYSLFSAGGASYNTAVGAGALVLNNADSNTALGIAALLLNTTGSENTAVGASALLNNTGGGFNAAVGVNALHDTTTSFNNAFGAYALNNSATGEVNDAFGSTALLNTVDGSHNCGFGDRALFSNVSGSNNTAIGDRAGENTVGSGNIAVGAGAGRDLTTGSNNIHIGHQGYPNQINTINIGVFGTHTATFIAGIYGTNTLSGIPVYIDASGQMGTVSSSRRFKDQIKLMDKASETILALKPVTFRYKSDKAKTPQFGLVAEEVAEVNPDLVVRDANGEIYTVRYDAVNAMLLNEFLKEHRKVEKLEAALEAVNKRLKEQDAKIQRVSAQMEMSKVTPQVVANQP